MAEGFVNGDGEKQPLTPGFAVPSPLGEGCYQVRRSREFKMPKLQSEGLRPGLHYSAPLGVRQDKPG